MRSAFARLAAILRLFLARRRKSGRTEGTVMMTGKIVSVLVLTNYVRVHMVRLSFSGVVRGIVTAKSKSILVFLEGAV